MTARPRPASTTLSIVVPAYEEAQGLAAGLRAIRAAVQQTGLAFEIVAVDDGSADDTWLVITQVGQEIPEEFYAAVAEILAYVYELSGKAKRKQTA